MAKRKKLVLVYHMPKSRNLCCYASKSMFVSKKTTMYLKFWGNRKSKQFSRKFLSTRYSYGSSKVPCFSSRIQYKMQVSRKVSRMWRLKLSLAGLCFNSNVNCFDTFQMENVYFLHYVSPVWFYWPYLSVMCP